MTEPMYFNALAALPETRRTAALDIRGLGYGPRRLVTEAQNAQRQDAEAKSRQVEYWCVFDVEAPEPHHGLNDAIQMARDNGIHIAVSNPCFELWLILHYAEHSRWLDTSEARSKRRRLDGSEGQGLDTREYMQRRDTASRRALRLAEMHERDGTGFPDGNPSSSVHRIVQAIESPDHETTDANPAQ
ncbi:RloB family protein [Candidatus Poriferisodalis sp.]|uniref:RloB family protein n=1 Tax=Candidatus Poriferisodalis sp. TaxID=3101277 RepID=UPI003B010517